MDIKAMKTLLQNIRRKYGDEIFQNGGRLCSYITDLSAGDRAEEEIRLIRRCYHLLPEETTRLVQVLSSQGNMAKVAGQVKSFREEMRQNFFSPEDIDYLADIMISAFGFTYRDVSDRVPLPPLVLDGPRLTAALVALDDQYQDDLWKDWRILDNLLADQDRELGTERRLVACVYDGAGNLVKRLVHEIVRNQTFATEISRLQQELEDACMAPVYIDVFIFALLETFGIEYENPLMKNMGYDTSEVPEITGGTGSGSGAGTKNTSGTGNGPGSTGGSSGTGNSQGTAGGSYGTGNTVGQISGTSSKIHGKDIKKLITGVLITVLLIFSASLYLKLKPDGTVEKDTEQDTGQDAAQASGQEDQMSDSTSSEMTDIADSLEEDEESLYIPEVEENIDIEQIDSTVYDDTLVDLHHYGRYMARGKNFNFAYPKKLYTSMSLDSGLFDNEYQFTGDDGSSLVYHKETPNYKYNAEEWREYVTGTLTEGMSEVSLASYSDSDEETHFYVTAVDGNMNVVIVSTFYLRGGPGEWMILKYPKPVDDDDALRKAYYVECLYCLAGFSDSKEQGFELRSYEDFVAGR